jgi:hypothetical protein
MNAKDVLKENLTTTQNLLTWYLADLSDADLGVRPVPAANNIAWQIGHLIASETMLADALPGARYPKLPESIAGMASGKSAKEPPPGGYLKKDEYIDWFNKVRAATIENVGRLSDADLAKANTGDMAKWAPTVASLVLLICNHTLMHAGQFSVTRRALGKPVLF